MSQALEAIVLAGGLGTRLKDVIQDIPKPMAPIGNQPFLDFILNRLLQQGLRKTILSVGYRHEVIFGHFGVNYGTMQLDYFIEKEPMGTGGGILGACKMLSQEHVVVMNGDTLFDVDIVKLMDAHIKSGADLSCALKPMQDFDRYGTVDIDANGRITAFNEKMPREAGLINGGVYILNRSLLLDAELPDKFSFEKEILEGWLHQKKFMGFVSDGYFIDIGIPSDYALAQQELPIMFS